MNDSHGVGSDLTDGVRRAALIEIAATLDRSPQRIHEQTPDGHRLLTLAVWSGDTAVVELLLQRGADPTWPEANAPRGAALHEAARLGRGDLVALLLRHGADPNAHVEASGNAVYASAKFPDIRARLEAAGGTLDPYDLVWLDEDDEALRRVAADPASAHAGCGGVYTAVVTRRKHDLLGRLLDAGVRVPPVPCGCRSYLLEDPDMLHSLLQRGGLDPDYADDSGSTLLHDLCRYGEPATRARCAARLIAAGANLGATDADGQTPLQLARRLGLHDLVSALATVDRT